MPTAHSPQGYRHALGHNVARASVPYGYTAMNVAGAGALIDTHGPPTTRAALLFLVGAIVGFTSVAAVAGHAGDRARVAVAPWPDGASWGAPPITRSRPGGPSPPRRGVRTPSAPPP